MARIFKDYVVVKCKKREQLQAVVSSLREKGWDYVGGVSYSAETDREFKNFLQAMELCEEIEEKKEIL